MLDYQSARASAFIERNRNLGDDEDDANDQRTNEAFVYRTETVKMPSSAVPLIRVSRPLNFEPAGSLEAAVTSMLQTMHRMPAGSIGSVESSSRLKIEATVSYSFILLSNLSGSVKSYLPLYLMKDDIAAGEDATAARRVAESLDGWRSDANPNFTQSSISFRLTIFATKIVLDEDEQLPLVQFQDLRIPARDPEVFNDWW